MINLVKTSSDNPDFEKLVRLLDEDLAIRDGEDHAFYAQFNKINKIKHVVVAYLQDKPVGCGAIKEYDPTTKEIKRMYVVPEHRKRGIATKVLAALEDWAKELGYAKCVLETGKMQPEAIGLYERSGYNLIPNYGQYAGVDNSLCFEKTVASNATINEV
ncbi:GNAT family N-acetyltransferase [Pontibacter qinzhouensis]|uniref:GNAT family N-acetyltransferase n=1 Tax=Pontibacter qinzhouensis TaxID=2603253 RepID=A0A5C8IPY9_9BACT|nr:GNAT family N-acetyltransferase [Pontibacter qinzhouensis]TXK23270.1 GNAT family N-acetyltransferase [Pontibacter qinzhouensis]